MRHKSGVYDALSRMESVKWSTLDEQGRYEAWSFYHRFVSHPWGYQAFCDHMDERVAFESLPAAARIARLVGSRA